MPFLSPRGQILNSQLGIVDFEPMKEAFILQSSHSHFTLPGLSLLPSISLAIHRNFQDAGPKGNVDSDAFASVSLRLLRLRVRYCDIYASLLLARVVFLQVACPQLVFNWHLLQPEYR
jgi:hypothetical protein